MIGLEYIVEYLRNDLYLYKCLLCDTQTARGTTILHLCGIKHRKAYLEKHHPELLIKQQQFSKRSKYTKQMKALALQVERMYGRKHIFQADEQNEKEACPELKNPKMSSTVNPEELVQLKGESQQISSEHISDLENIIVKTEIQDQLEDFKANDDFLDYLRSFEIKNDRDASFIQEITKNCTNALMTFREEQTNTQVSSTIASSSHSKNIKNLSDKADFSTMSSQEKCFTSAQIPPMFQNTCEATETFFSSIKNMNASEVIEILKKIAATSPAFRGINIPSLIKYLKETGRLKNA
ncbi:uncharacterized protein LOC142651754 isoform X2 [Rhinoderma darwinii]